LRINRGLNVDVLLKMFGHHYDDQWLLLGEFVVFVTVFTKTQFVAKKARNKDNYLKQLSAS